MLKVLVLLTSLLGNEETTLDVYINGELVAVVIEATYEYNSAAFQFKTDSLFSDGFEGEN